jgi:hypothetical protein
VVKRRGSTSVDAHLCLAQRPSSLRIREIEIVVADGAFELPRACASKKHYRGVRLDPLDFAPPWADGDDKNSMISVWSAVIMASEGKQPHNYPSCTSLLLTLGHVPDDDAPRVVRKAIRRPMS